MSSPMMIFVLPILVILSGLVSSSKIQDHFNHVPMSDVASAIQTTCQVKNSATKGELMLLHKMVHLSESRESKCMLSCILDVYGAFDDSGAPNINSLDLFFSAQFKPDDRDRLMQIWVDCYVKVDRLNIVDRCDHHFEIAQCVNDDLAAGTDDELLSLKALCCEE